MDTFTALADPTRRTIIETLANGEHTFGELAANFEISRPAVSQHLKVLKDAGMVSSRADAQRRVYNLQPEALGELEAWLHSVRSFWNEHLDTLQQVLAESD